MPKIDAAIFADTGEEPAAVMEHLKWLKALNGPPIIERNAGKRLGDGLIDGIGPTGYSYETTSKRSGERIRYASIPAFTLSESGDVGMTRRQCTSEHKTNVVERSIRRDIVGLKPKQKLPKDVVVHQYIGLSFDEPRRVIRVRARFFGKTQWMAHFPLFETNTTRTGCKKWLASRVPHIVPRSSCVFCPFHSDREWRGVKAVLCDWNRACEIDDALRKEESTCSASHTDRLFCHRSCVPLRDVDLSEKPDTDDNQLEMAFAAECEGMCGV
jgi:hypothetical protein